MKITGMKNFHKKIQKELRNRPKAIKKVLTAIGDHHVKHAVARAPFQHGHLKDSIAKQVDISNNKKASVFIGIPLNARASSYAIRMHEDYYELGEGSQDLQARSTVLIGRKYLSRGKIAAQKRDLIYLKKYLKH